MTTVITWLSFAYVLGLIMRLVGLPPLVGYLVAGFILSAYGYESNAILDSVSHVGVLLLLFSVGLKLRLKSLIRAEILAGSLLHMLITVGCVYLLLTAMGVESQLALLVGIALSFSSTVVAAKVLESKRELRAFHGRVAIGILIMQDIVAVAVLSVGNNVLPSFWSFLLIGIFLIKPLFYKLLDISGHGELVILYGLMVAVVLGGHGFEYFGLSAELGALLLGVMLAGHKRAVELSSAIWSIKELLLVGFFLQIGLIGLPTMEVVQQAFLINLLVPLKALLFFFIFILFRLRARSSFLASLTLATFSEFGLIVANVAVKNNWITNEWLVLLAVAVAMSFMVNAPLNRYAHELYAWLESFLARFETSKSHPDDEPINVGNSHIMIVGMGRVGTGAYDLLREENERVIGLDSDPVKVQNHREIGRRVLYADAEDPALFANINLEGVHTIMLAMPEFSAKLLAAKQLRKLGFKGKITTTVVFDEEVEPLQQAGADFIYNYYDGIGASFARGTLDSPIQSQAESS